MAQAKPRSNRGPRRPPDDEMTRLSKSLSWILRHGASKEGLQLEQGGFLNLSDLMKLPQFSSYTLDDVQYVVENNNKQRFALITDPKSGELKIRANQGHSLEVDLQLQRITDVSEVPVAVHGTNMGAWKQIKTQGLNRMTRLHIHFAAGEPGADGIISGWRGSCDVLIYLDVDAVLKDGIELYRSENNVILSPGMADGSIPPVYFKKVIHRFTGKDLVAEEMYEDDAISADQLADEMEREKKKKKKKPKNQ